MTRVTDLARSQALLAQLQALKSSSFQTERQVATGKKAQYFKEIGKDTGVLLSAKALEGRITQFQKTGELVSSRIELQNVQLQSLSDSAGALRQSVLDAVSLNKGVGFMAKISQLFETSVGILNSKIDGKYIYSGTRSDVPPVNISKIGELVAIPAAANVFDNNTLKQSARLDESLIIEYGVVASEIATDLFDAIKRIADYDANPATGPFQSDLTPAQAAFLQGEMVNLIALTDQLTAVVAENGSKFEQVQTTTQRHVSTEIYVTGFISDIEDVDIAEAITRLNEDQTATEATMRMLSTLNRLTLLDFL